MPESNEPANLASKSRTSKLAIASFIMGLVSLTCVLWPLLGLPAIICGIIALVKISESRGMLKGKGFAITGIVIPAAMMVIFTIVGILADIVYLGVLHAVASEQNLTCENNERQLSLALITYANDSSGMLPRENWMEVIQEKGMITGDNVFTCQDAEEIAVSYVLNKYIKNINEVKNPARTILIFEAHEETGDLGGPEDMIFPHKQGESDACNVGFVDGHTEFVTIENKDTLLWFPDQQ